PLSVLSPSPPSSPSPQCSITIPTFITIPSVFYHHPHFHRYPQLQGAKEQRRCEGTEKVRRNSPMQDMNTSSSEATQHEI
ncbi:uncharacterized, partial [Tachysurus ichikawai]